MPFIISKIEKQQIWIRKEQHRQTTALTSVCEIFQIAWLPEEASHNQVR